ncbi:MAG: hypothetical protein QOI58_3356, partial [Thermoanaerobaculia bacterium]|nr:hypothetical protein [Thermoanaerobaculia bacterium]
MKTKLIYTLAAALVALAPAVRANWNLSPTTAIAIAVSDDDDDREKDRKDREKERAEAKVEKEEDLYDSGTDALDDHEWRRAAAAFSKV